MNNLLLRSMLYIPGYKERYLTNVDSLNADAIIFDLEDSVPVIYKEKARENLRYFFNNHQNHRSRFFVRLNSIESKMLLEDLKYVMLDSVDGFMLTKIYTENDMVYYDKLFSQLENDNGFYNGKFKFVPLIETASAVLDSYKIARSTKRNVALAFGGEDFLTDIVGFHGNPPKGLDYARSHIALAARSAGIIPIDTPYLKVKDIDGFNEEERLSFEIGFGGCQCLHPMQVKYANICFWPTEDELREAKLIVDAIDESSSKGSGVAMFEGRMIGPPMEKRARNIINLVIKG